MKKIEVGTEIDFNERLYKASLVSIKKHLLPVIEVIKCKFNALSIGEFSQSDWEDIYRSGAKATEGRYFAVIDKDISKFQSPVLAAALAESAQVPVIEFREAVSRLKGALSDAIAGSLTAGPFKIEVSDVFIDKEGTPGINLEVIKERYRMRLANENQTLIYRRAAKLADELNSLAADMREYEIKLIDGKTAGIFWVGEDRVEVVAPTFRYL